jgi:hypothetical protein
MKRAHKKRATEGYGAHDCDSGDALDMAAYSSSDWGAAGRDNVADVNGYMTDFVRRVTYALAGILLASSAHAQSLLPSQDSRNFSVSQYAGIVRSFLESKLLLLTS